MIAILDATEAMLTAIIAFPEVMTQYPLTGKCFLVCLLIGGAFFASRVSKGGRHERPE